MPFFTPGDFVTTQRREEDTNSVKAVQTGMSKGKKETKQKQRNYAFLLIFLLFFLPPLYCRRNFETVSQRVVWSRFCDTGGINNLVFF